MAPCCVTGTSPIQLPVEIQSLYLIFSPNSCKYAQGWGWGGVEGRQGCRICPSGDFLLGYFDSQHLRYTLPSIPHQPMYGIKLLSQFPLKLHWLFGGKGRKANNISSWPKVHLGFLSLAQDINHTDLILRTWTSHSNLVCGNIVISGNSEILKTPNKLFGQSNRIVDNFKVNASLSSRLPLSIFLTHPRDLLANDHFTSRALALCLLTGSDCLLTPSSFLHLFSLPSQYLFLYSSEKCSCFTFGLGYCKSS